MSNIGEVKFGDNTEKNLSGQKFIINDEGVFYKTGEDEKIWICSKLEVKALVRDRSSENWGRLIEFHDEDKILHRWSMPMEMLKGGGEELRNELLRLGLNISPHAKARNLLVQYIMTSLPALRGRCIRRTGWYDRVFVLPHSTIGETSETIMFQSEITNTDYKISGTLQEWQTHIAKLCEGNSRLVFSVSTAFAALLLYVVDHESGGIHFVGESSTGKTTALRVAASVFGGADYLNRWRATANGLEALAAIRSDTLLILDELSQVNPIEAGEIAYMLANGSGKSRANRSGNTRARNEWRVLFLSAGEIGLADHLREGGKSIKAGQEVRLVDIPADAGVQKGLFEKLHGHESGAQFSKVLVGNAQKYYGTPLTHFLKIITVSDQWENNVQLLKILIQKFLQVNLPEDASGQVYRVCERFALISAAGELASLYKITGWVEGESEKSAVKCFEDWLEHRGTHGNQERVAILSQIKSFFELHGESRFSEWSGDKISSVISRTINRTGFKKKIISKDGKKEAYQYCVLPETFKKEMCLSFDVKHVIRVLVAEGWIEPSKDGNPSRREYLPGLGQCRCYVFTVNMWNG